MNPMLRAATLRFQRELLQRLLRLPRPLLVRMAGGRRIVRDAAPLDEQAQLLLKMAERLDSKPTWRLDVAEARAEIKRGAYVVAPEKREMASVSSHECEGPNGPVPLRVYRPRALADDRRAPALVWVHGGGFVTGDLDDYDGLCRQLADAIPAVIVSVDYRLAPEHKYPAAVLDARAERWGIDAGRIALGGDSAGGNLSAVVARRLRGVAAAPKFQLLVYPATDMTCSMPSHRLFAEGFFLESKSIEWFRDRYLQTVAQRTEPDASPLFADDLAGLAPAMVLVAGFDPLRDEGLAYAEKLRAAGVPVVVRNDAGMFHGYFSSSGAIARSIDAVEAAAAEVRRGLR
jgi:acetyl esterase